MNGDESETENSRSKLSLTPSFIADEFLNGTSFVTLLESHQMWYFDRAEHVWRADGESWLMAWVAQFYPDASRGQYNDIKYFVQGRSIISVEQFKPNPYYIQFKGGFKLNLRELKPAVKESRLDDPMGMKDTAEHYLRICLDTELDEKAKPPMIFLDALQKAIPDGRDLYHCLQAFASILLIRTMRIEKAFFFLGSGGNGKSTIMKAMENIFNPYISHVDLTDLVKDQFASASLIDKLANVYADIQSLKFKDMAIFKAISTGDTISVAGKYEKRHDETIKVIQIYSANKMPYIDDKNPGFLRRASPIVFDMVIKDRDPYIDEKLNKPEERKRILALLIRIARVTKRKGFLFEKSESAIQAILEEKEDPITGFLNDEEWVKQDAQVEIVRGDLYQLYLSYCKGLGCSAKQKTAFSRYISERGFDSRTSHNKRYWIGLGSARKPKATLDE